MIIVLGSNVIVAAFAGRGLCNSIFELCLDRYRIHISEYILAEVHKALCKKIKLPPKNADVVLGFLREFCLTVKHKKLKASVCRDKDDDNILALAKQCKADYIVTGDKDLLELKKFESVLIVTPRAFWTIAKQEKN